jgi:hypothetical protein
VRSREGRVAKALLYRLFGTGKILEPTAVLLRREGLLLLEEGIPGSVTYRDFRAPGKSFSWSRRWYTASVALTEVRLLALRYSRPIIDVPWTDPRVHRLQISTEGEGVLLVAFDAGLFHDDWSGRIEYRFRTPQAPVFRDGLCARVGGKP